MEEYGLRSKVLWEVKSNIRWKKLKDTRLGTKIPRTYTHKIEVSERLCIVILVFILCSRKQGMVEHRPRPVVMSDNAKNLDNCYKYTSASTPSVRRFPMTPECNFYALTMKQSIGTTTKLVSVVTIQCY